MSQKQAKSFLLSVEMYILNIGSVIFMFRTHRILGTQHWKGLRG